ncbi:MAG: peptide ABC transporter substrate-binding protein [Oscillospiraceae bacterium]|jgi:oligopeptide transport system substrate-binding protein|nr:peptide ABC transporter substrate-binding protein [Oscillospiraceae bacterium]
MRKIKKWLAPLLVSALMLGGVSSALAQDAQNVLRWTSPGEVTTMDSGKSYDVISGEAISFFQESLYRLDAQSQPIPALAAELPKVSEDGLTLNIAIRDDAYYSDGTKITAADVVYAARRVVDPATGSQSAKDLSFLANGAAVAAGEAPVDTLGIKALSDTELEITLTAPNSYINQELSSSLLAPVNQAFAEAQGANYGLSADALLYSGPFALSGWNGTDISWQYVKNPYYWDKDNIYFDVIDVQVVKEVATGVNLYEAGELDGARISGDYVNLYDGTDDLWIIPTLRMTNLELGVSSSEPLQNLNLRKALLYSINRDELSIAILNGTDAPAVATIPDGIASNPENGKSVAEDFGGQIYYDTAKAQEYFAKALEELGVDEVTLELVTSDEDKQIKEGQYLQSVFETNLPGLKIELSNVPSSVRFEIMMAYDFDLALGGWSGRYDPTSYIKQFETSYEHNHGKWVSPELTEWVNQLETTDGLDFALRWEHLRQANQYLIDNAVVVPLVQASYTYLITPRLKGVVTHVLGTAADVTRAYFED